jgi:2-polyprenyl-3-methyl-5-hydroxy-6-metoxy-1,4-benzoquinol methylase
MINPRETINRLIREAWQRGDPTGWFEPLYARAANGQGVVPWAHMQPNPELTGWLQARAVNGAGQRALVIGCGLGDDAEALAERGFEVTAFDISTTAIDWCRQRFPESSVAYHVADLLQLPAAWQGAYDFVLESRTIQSLPHDLCAPACEAIAALVAPGGTLLVLCLGREPEEDRSGIPWPLSRVELAAFQQQGLTERSFEVYDEGGSRRFRVEYAR